MLWISEEQTGLHSMIFALLTTTRIKTSSEANLRFPLFESSNPDHTTKVLKADEYTLLSYKNYREK